MSDEDCKKDEDDEDDGDRCGSNEGKIKGSKANKSREVTTPHITSSDHNDTALPCTSKSDLLNKSSIHNITLQT